MDARTEYESRLERWRATKRIQDRLFIRIGNWRLFLGVLEAVLVWLVFGPHRLPAWVLVVPILAFIGLAAFHSRVSRAGALAVRALSFYARGLKRMDDQWTEAGSTGEQFRNPNHLYAEDLDLFGKGSLFQLLSTARTSAGEQRLADWLLSPASRAQAVRRQEAIHELADRLDLRESLASLGGDMEVELDVEAITKWGQALPVRFGVVPRILAPILGLTSAVCTLAFFAQRLPPWLLAALFTADLLVAYVLRRRVSAVLEAAEGPGHGLPLFSLILQRLESESFHCVHLQELRASLNAGGELASARIKALSRRMDFLDSSDHLLVKALRPLVLWREQIAMSIEAWRTRSGSDIGTWLSAVAEFEALSSFASLYFERPDWRFPAFTDQNGPLLDAKCLRHPLIASSRSVPNDVSLGIERRLFIVSGSNMSGKSTLLRAVGLNCVLAWAGAPVPAASLTISVLQPAASIRVSDSLLDNRSRFFAEISRLRQIVDLTKCNAPVLFLLDELLSGTNSHDRRIGAAAIVAKLVRDGAIGLITTHDLALAEMERDLGSVAENVHFEDRIVNGEVEFDYRLRPGLVTHSNALELMRAIGLEV